MSTEKYISELFLEALRQLDWVVITPDTSGFQKNKKISPLVERVSEDKVKSMGISFLKILKNAVISRVCGYFAKKLKVKVYQKIVLIVLNEVQKYIF